MAAASPIFTGPNKVESYTSTVYGLIRDQKFTEAIRILSVELQNFPRSRAALSLLGYCYYALQDFRSAAQIYEELCKQCPEVDSYRVYYAQCLYKAGLYPEATKACARVDSEQFSQRLLQLQSAIRYEEDDLAGSRALLSQCVQDDPDTLVNFACITFKEGKYEEARRKFTEALAGSSYSPETAYNIALCHYKLKQYGPALAILNDIIERGVREHPELSVGSGSDGVEVRSVGNTSVLRETALVEAFNLKASIQISMGDAEGAREALSDMPPRSEEELDPVTLHNIALAYLDVEPGEGTGPWARSGGLAGAFSKLNFLLANPPFPPEAFGNLLLLYVRHGYQDLAADVMAENAHLTVRYLISSLYDFLDATLLASTSPAEAFRRLDALTGGHVEALRRHTKAIQDARLAGDGEGVKAALSAYDEALERYMPVLLSSARIYWDREQYEQVERILRQAAEFASEHEGWQLAMAHVLFMQEGKYGQAIRHYEPIVRRHMDGSAAALGSTMGMGAGVGGRKTGGLLDITAIVLANLCVAYIMTSQNEAAEGIMRAIEREEERYNIAMEGQAGANGRGKDGQGPNPAQPHIFHLCIVNLVIGTLYCSRGNFEFGISRVMKSLEPLNRKLGPDTWHYAKRALLALAEGLAKHTVHVRDGMIGEVLEFLDAVDKNGKGISAMVAPPTVSAPPGAGEAEAAAAAAAAALEAAKHTVSFEARLLKRIFLKLQ